MAMRALAGRMQTAALARGTLGFSKVLTGRGFAAADLDGLLSLSIYLYAGKAATSAGASGSLTVTPSAGTSVVVAGAGWAAGALVGTIGIASGLSGTGSAAANASGTLGVTLGLAGAAGVASDLDGSLSIVRALAGLGSCSSSLSGSLRLTLGASGFAPAAGFIRGDLSVTAPVGQAVAVAARGGVAARAVGDLTMSAGCSGQPQWKCDCIRLGGTLPCLRGP